MLTKQQRNPYIWDKSIKIKTKEGKYETEMYEVLVKLENELKIKKYTIEQLEELKELLKGLKTQEVRIERKEK